MRITNNIMAMNTHRQYGVNNTNVAKSIEKLSSGYRINRAGDDAAGLAISEKMRAQIRGLTMASKNSLDAISLVQTAEGALQETHNILQRMRELSVQSASDTNESNIDRDALKKEFQALIDEINDTANKTTFNEMLILNGDFAAFKVADITAEIGGGGGPFPLNKLTVLADALTFGAKEAGNVVMNLGISQVGSPPTGGSIALAGAAPASLSATFTTEPTAIFMGAYSGKDITFTSASDGSGGFTVTARVGGVAIGTATIASGSQVLDNGGTLSLTFTDTNNNTVGALQFTNNAVGSNVNANGMNIALQGATVGLSGGTAPAIALKLDGEEYHLKAGQTKLQLDNGVALEFEAIADDFSNVSAIFGGFSGSLDITIALESTGTAFMVQTGANKGDNLFISIDKMDAVTLGIYCADISTRETASWGIKYADAAINKVSTQRAALGALHNRLEHKIANLDNTAENLQAAESRIRDLDMAKEMTQFTKNNILNQAATAMLAQANTLPQGVLQLLR